MWTNQGTLKFRLVIHVVVEGYCEFVGGELLHSLGVRRQTRKCCKHSSKNAWSLISDFNNVMFLDLP